MLISRCNYTLVRIWTPQTGRNPGRILDQNFFSPFCIGLAGQTKIQVFYHAILDGREIPISNLKSEALHLAALFGSFLSAALLHSGSIWHQEFRSGREDFCFSKGKKGVEGYLTL